MSKIRLNSNDSEAQKIIDELSKDSKTYDKLLYGLQLLGNFNNTIEVMIYENIDDKDIKLYCEDLDGSIFIFYGKASNKNDILKIEKEDGIQNRKYDLILAKKFVLNSDNIKFTRSDQINNFRYGRIISDYSTFMSMFLSNDLGYYFDGSFELKDYDNFFSKINSLDNSPSLFTFIKLLNDNIIFNDDNNFTSKVYAFKDFKVIEKITIENIKNKEKVKKL